MNSRIIFDPKESSGNKKIGFGFEMPHPMTNVHAEMRITSAIERKLYLSNEIDRENVFEILYFLRKNPINT